MKAGHNPAAGLSLAEAIGRLPPRPLHLICGMLKTKDIEGYLRPLAEIAESLHGMSIPGETATLSGSETVEAARNVGFAHATEVQTAAEAIAAITGAERHARILICGSLYLAGHILRENG